MNALALAFLAAVVAANDPGTLIGNGRLTAVADEFGRLSTCRWPGPAMNNQLGGGGARWGIIERGGISWLEEATREPGPVQPWAPGISTARLALPNGATAVTQMFVPPEDDVLVSHITLYDLEQPPDLVWHADFSPAPVLLPELAGIRELAPRDFAAYVKDNRIYQFRPKGPGANEWHTAAGADWEAFAESEGVWIVMACPQQVRASCGLAGGDKSAASRFANAAVGDCDTAVFLRPLPASGAYVATVFAAFGSTRAQAEAALDRVIRTDFDALLAQPTGYWVPFAETPVPPGAPGYARIQKDLATLGMAIDRATGAFTRDPAGAGCSALCYTRDCAWASMALDLAGREKEAGQVLAFVASTVRKEQRRGKPMGSLPMAAYGDGTEALPHLALDADAPAYALGAIWKHAVAINDDARRREFIENLWPAAELMADFLAGWTDSRNREPLYSFDCRKGRDQQGPERLLTTYMGVDAALRLARESGRPEPDEWARRKVELDALIRFQLVDRQTTSWKKGPILPYWHDLMAQDWALKGAPLPSWDSAVQDLIQSPLTDPAQAAAIAALVWRNDKNRRADISAAVEKASSAPPGLNALKAAQRLIADFRLLIAD
ncbi:MAG: hypothetical protein NTZ09_16790 [Candidatus Hydrogenedentes bacterium]|nr:hypothetical protein [Candidatus Hydrogenedentota bacterium]